MRVAAEAESWVDRSPDQRAAWYPHQAVANGAELEPVLQADGLGVALDEVVRRMDVDVFHASRSPRSAGRHGEHHQRHHGPEQDSFHAAHQIGPR
jgi:hypothetical protein